MNKLSAPDLWHEGKVVEKKIWWTIACCFVGFINMFWQAPYIPLPWRYLLLITWIYPLGVGIYIGNVASSMKYKASQNWGSDEEGTEI